MSGGDGYMVFGVAPAERATSGAMARAGAVVGVCGDCVMRCVLLIVCLEQRVVEWKWEERERGREERGREGEREERERGSLCVSESERWKRVSEVKVLMVHSI